MGADYRQGRRHAINLNTTIVSARTPLLDHAEQRNPTASL